ncbi:MAG: nuclear transport factor 2 family protein [Betaproteobacteria bacterium]|nr:nuclear transport factor 2 family protein [Betaproteobacteria bacterium]
MHLWLLCAIVLQGLAGCGRDDPEAALVSAERELVAAIEAKDAGRALDLLHPDFVVGSHDRDWARRTMLLMFNRHKKVGVMVLSSKRHIHTSVPDRATSEGEIALIGAENILPDAADRFQVRLGWVMVDGQWKLLNLEWFDGRGRGL